MQDLKRYRIAWATRLAAYLLIVAVYTVIVDLYESRNVKSLVEASGAVMGTLIVGVLLVFRTNTANDRWWEGRKLWGQLVNDSRTLAVKFRTYLGSTSPCIPEVAAVLVAFPVALKEHLRDGVKLNVLPGFEHESADPIHVPLALSEKLYAIIGACKQNRTIDQADQQILDFHCRSLMDICGACERIKNSPIALSYRMILRQGIALNLLGLPWYLVPDFHLWSVPIVLITSYFLIGIEMVAEDIEEPFSLGRDKLPLDDLCTTIDRSVRQVLGATSSH